MSFTDDPNELENIEQPPVDLKNNVQENIVEVIARHENLQSLLETIQDFRLSETLQRAQSFTSKISSDPSLRHREQFLHLALKEH